MRAAPVCFRHSGWRGSSGPEGFPARWPLPDPTGSPAGTVGLFTHESQAEAQGIMEPSHLQHLLEEQIGRSVQVNGERAQTPQWEECVGRRQKRMWDPRSDWDRLWKAFCPVAFTSTHVAGCRRGWCWCSFRVVGAQGKVCTTGSGTGTGSVCVAVCMKSYLYPPRLSSSLL